MRKQSSRSSLLSSSNATSNTSNMSNSDNSSSCVTRINLAKRDMSSKNLRRRYLHKLGFQQMQCKPTIPISPSTSSGTSQMILSRYSYTYQSCINDKSNERHENIGKSEDEKSYIKEEKVLHNSPKCVGDFVTENPHRCTSPNTSRMVKKEKRNVSFDETVTVLSIPSKDAYSDRIRKHLWTDPHEMIQNTTRNSIEFASENWDWRQAADDIEFYLCPQTGEKIHPCHTSSYEYSSSQQYYFNYNTRPLNRNPFFEKSKQAAMAWQQQHSNPHYLAYLCQ